MWSSNDGEARREPGVSQHPAPASRATEGAAMLTIGTVASGVLASERAAAPKRDAIGFDSRNHEALDVAADAQDAVVQEGARLGLRPDDPSELDLRLVRERDGTWAAYAIELNLRKGGTTHPFLTLQFLTDGAYDPATALFNIHVPPYNSRIDTAPTALASQLLFVDRQRRAQADRALASTQDEHAGRV